MPEPNAFALPGGQIFVTTGMLDLGLDDDMLANVLGHEIGHVVHEHSIHMQRKATLMTVLGNLLVAGVVIGESRSNNRQNTPQAPYDPRVGYQDYGRQPDPGRRGGEPGDQRAAAAQLQPRARGRGRQGGPAPGRRGRLQPGRRPPALGDR